METRLNWITTISELMFDPKTLWHVDDDQSLLTRRIIGRMCVCAINKCRNCSNALLPWWPRLPCGHYAFFSNRQGHITCRGGRGPCFSSCSCSCSSPCIHSVETECWLLININIGSWPEGTKASKSPYCFLSAGFCCIGMYNKLQLVVSNSTSSQDELTVFASNSKANRRTVFPQSDIAVLWRESYINYPVT